MKDKEMFERRRKEMFKLRRAGHSYREIGERFGISAQRVHVLIGGKVRKNNVDIERIVFDGIYQLFVQDQQMTFSRFARIVYEYDVGPKEREMVRRFLTGKTNSKFSLAQINKILQYIGKPYEEVFRRRDELEEQ